MTFQHISAPTARVMGAAQRAVKLRLIARLTAEELRGWLAARDIVSRPCFDGEQAALAARARELGVRM